MAKAELTAVITPICRRIAEQMGFELVEVALDREPTGKYLRIYIDKPEGITLDDCEAYHRTVMPLVENYDYDFMEVSSPGIDRPLKSDRDFERNLGAEVEIRLFRALDGVKELNGVLAGFDGESLTIMTGGAEKVIPRKAAAVVRPVVDMEGVEDVILGEDPSEAQTEQNTEESEKTEP
jgi:ribosome maturation factor RimP